MNIFKASVLGLVLAIAPMCAANANHAVLSLSRRKVRVKDDNGALIKEFPVAIGKPGYTTPLGAFSIESKIYQPHWRNPWTSEVKRYGQSPLGIAWLGFAQLPNGVVGFHGTLPSMRASIGGAESHGCVRMFDEDMIEMFDLLDVGDTVHVIE